MSNPSSSSTPSASPSASGGAIQAGDYPQIAAFARAAGSEAGLASLLGVDPGVFASSSPSGAPSASPSSS